MTRQAARLDVPVYAALCASVGGGWLDGGPTRERAAGASVGALAAPRARGINGVVGGAGLRPLRWTMSPLPILAPQTSFFTFPQMEALWLTICKEFGNGVSL